MPFLLSPINATILGIVEGITEFLPISSTGHMILVQHLLGLDDLGPSGERGVKAFEVVIQLGALFAVIGLYRQAITSMIRGVLGKDPGGLVLLTQLFVAFLPAAVVGLAAAKWIKAHLFGVGPVVAALSAGGVLMIALDAARIRKHGGRAEAAWAGADLKAMTLRYAFIIGCAQCIAMWPGTSRSMITMVAAMILGFSPLAAAEFSFLLALPTLSAATAHDFYKDGKVILEVTGWPGLLLGFGAAFVTAWFVVKAFLTFLTRHGLAMFGWYRIVLAGGIVLFLLLHK